MSEPSSQPNNALKNAAAGAAQSAVSAIATHFGVPAPVASSLAATLSSVVQSLPIPMPPSQPGGPVSQLVHDHAAAAVQVVGTLLGHPQIAKHIGEAIGAASTFIPFSAVPQGTLAPQGIFGDLISKVAPTTGNVVGSLANLLPFSAVPSTTTTDLAPQGIFGSLVNAFAPTIGKVIGTAVGHPNIGTTAGNVVGTVGSLLPFSAVPFIPGQPPRLTSSVPYC